MKSRIFFCVFLFSTVSVVTVSLVNEAVAHAQTLSWEKCVRLTTENNSALKAARASLQSSDAQVSAAKNGYFPQLSGSTGYTHSSNSSGSAGLIGAGESIGTSNYTLSLNLSQNIFNGFSDHARVQQAEASDAVARIGLETTKAQVSFALKSSFEGLVYSQDLVQLAREITGRREQNLRMVELRFRDGRENKGSVLLYRAYVLDAKLAELQGSDAAKVAQTQLAQALGADEFDMLGVSGQTPLREPETWSGSSGIDLSRLALETPTYRQAIFQETAAEAGVTLARSGFFPTLGMNGSIGKAGPSWFPDTYSSFFGATLTLPLFNGGKDYYGTQAALASRSSAQDALKESSHQALVSLTQAWTVYGQAVQKLKVDRAYLDAAKLRAEIARADYANGLTSFQDWDLVETDLITREKSLIQSQQARVVAEAAWEQAQGKGAIQ